MLVSGLLHSCAFCTAFRIGNIGASCMMMRRTVSRTLLIPCSSSLAGFKELHDKFRGQPFEIVGEQSVAIAS